MNEGFWFAGSVLLLVIWLGLWALNCRLRRAMMVASVLLLPTGLAQVLFVPKYWNPPSLFNLNARLGFDIESLVFSFAVGGISIALYELFVQDAINNFKPKPRDKRKTGLATMLSVGVFICAYVSGANPIHSFIAALFAGALFLLFVRPGIGISSLKGGTVFMCFYVFLFLAMYLAFPDFVSDYWNLAAISRIHLAGIPAEEIIYSFAFGMVWFMIYLLSIRRYVIK